jgi:biopolymer transport protein TolR
MEVVHKRKRSLTLFTGLDTTAFTVVLVMVVFTLWIVDNAKPMVTRGVSADPPYVSRPVSMQGALRDDAMQITILRDGQVYFDNDRIWSDTLAYKIQTRLKDREVERKVYVVADRRAQWGVVKAALDQVRSTGIIRVAFLVSPYPPPITTR